METASIDTTFHFENLLRHQMHLNRVIVGLKKFSAQQAIFFSFLKF